MQAEQQAMSYRRIVPPDFGHDEGFRFRQALLILPMGLGLLIAAGWLLWYSLYLHPRREPWPWYSILLALCWESGLIGLGIGAAVSGLRALAESTGLWMRKRAWRRRALRAEVPILDRKQEHNPYAESREEMFPCELTIRVPWDAAGQPGEQVLRIPVGEGTYDRQAGRQFATILRSPEDPDMFIFDGD